MKIIRLTACLVFINFALLAQKPEEISLPKDIVEMVKENRLPDILNLLKSSKTKDKLEAIKALEMLNNAEAVPSLLDFLKKNQEEEMGGTETVIIQNQLTASSMVCLSKLSNVSLPVSQAGNTYSSEQIKAFISNIEGGLKVKR